MLVRDAAYRLDLLKKTTEDDDDEDEFRGGCRRCREEPRTCIKGEERGEIEREEGVECARLGVEDGEGKKGG